MLPSAAGTPSTDYIRSHAIQQHSFFPEDSVPMAVLQDRYPTAPAADTAGCQVPIIKSTEKAEGIDSTFALCPQACRGGFSIISATSSTGSGIGRAATTIAAITTSTYNASTSTTTSSSISNIITRSGVACPFLVPLVHGIHPPPSAVDYDFALLSPTQYLATYIHSLSLLLLLLQRLLPSGSLITSLPSFGPVNSLVLKMQLPIRMHQHATNILPHPTKKTVIPFIVIMFCDAYYILTTVGHDTALVHSMTRALAILHHNIGATMTPLPHACYYHALNRIHGNNHPLYQSILLLPHVAAWVASYSAPFSIIDGALATLSQPSSHRWTMLLFMSSLSCNHPITYQP